jgi:signal transduction histidine kinase/streptogramin lyase
MANLVSGLLVLAWLLPGPGADGRLPIQVFTTADGLGSNVVHRIVRDSRGFLWFCTREGLSRFDGYQFVTFGVEQGLPSPVVHDVLETGSGDLWLGTREGLVRFDPLGDPSTRADATTGRGPRFRTVPTGEEGPTGAVHALLEDRAGVLWAGTATGLWRLESAPGAGSRLVPVEIGLPVDPGQRTVRELLEDPSGGLWVGASGGLYRIGPGARAGTPPVAGMSGDVDALLLDRRGDLWIGTRGGGLFRAKPDPDTGRLADLHRFGGAEGFPEAWVLDLAEASDGSLWAATTVGLVRILSGDGRVDARFRLYGLAEGLPSAEVRGIEEERDGRLWIATEHGGAARLDIGGFEIFDAADFGTWWTQSLLTTRDGAMLAAAARDSGWSLFGYEGERLEKIAELPDRPSWGWNQTVLADRHGDWWVGTWNGVFRFTGVETASELSRATPAAVYTRAEGLAADVVLRLFADSRGDVWIGTGLGHNGLSRWRRATGSLEHFASSEGLPALETHFVSAFAEDRSGAVWIGFSGDGGLVRWRDGRFTRYAREAGLPPGAVWNLLVDSLGRLWAASYQGGLVRCDDPEAEVPTFQIYSTAEGLSSNTVTAIVEDAGGMLYVATGRGIDRLDPPTGQVVPVTRRAGFPAGDAEAAVADRSGALWFKFPSGVARLRPRIRAPLAPPPTFITGVRIGGDSVRVSALGQAAMESGVLPAGGGQVEIDYVAPGGDPGGSLRYEVRLEGAEDSWGQPTESRSIRYARLSPGSYHFHVRAVDGAGVSGEAASFSFSIPAPLWRRPWFVALVGLALAAAAVALDRLRVRRLLEVANLRTRIATDLHDDIGANLTRIAVTSEVARRLAGEDGAGADRRLASIAELARESITSLAEIVWAVHPERDRLEDLIGKMREFAEDLVQSRDIELRFDGPGPDGGARLDIDVRRDLFLIFKEAIRNAVRHSGCSRISVDVRADASGLVLQVRDDGSGFDPDAVPDGNGLVSMRRRAEGIGARLSVETRREGGTSVRLIRPTAGTRFGAGRARR